MSSQSTSPIAVALPQPLHANLLLILRRANHHYARVARDFRLSLRPTHHARKRAQKLKLEVSIQSALGLDPKQVSVIPLPVLATPLPVAVKTYETAASRRGPGAPMRLPSYLVGRELELKRPVRPVLRCDVAKANGIDKVTAHAAQKPVATIAAPRAIRAQNTPWRPVISHWSTTESQFSSLDIASAKADKGAAVVYSSDYEEGMDLDDSSPVIERRQVAAVAAGRVVYIPDARARTKRQPLPTRRRHAVPNDVPVDVVNRHSWASDVSSACSTSGSDSARSAGGPITPIEEMPKLTIRIKRKSSESFIDMDDSDCSSMEKRPKYERKHWIHPTTKRSGQHRSTASVGSPF